MENNKELKEIDVRKIISHVWAKKKNFFIVWIVVFVLSCVWIFPQPRYYKASVALAPENAGEEIGGGLASIASSFGFNLGSLAGNDAIYPTLYPDLFESTDFIVSLFDIKVKTKDGSLETDYFDYLKNHQKNNILTLPFNRAKNAIKDFFAEPEVRPVDTDGQYTINPFWLSKKEQEIVEQVQDNILCTTDKKTDVTTIAVTDQDPYIAATLADSIRVRLQNFITDYRTSKARMDMEYYQNMADSAFLEYEKAIKIYSDYADAYKNATREAYNQRKDALEQEAATKYAAYAAMNTQVQAYKVKVQEKTPAFTVLKSVTVPVKPAGPKRVLFVIGMLLLSTIITFIWIARKELHITAI